MRTIHKHLLPIRDIVSITVHQGAEVLAVDMQNGMICAWMLEDTDLPEMQQRFFILGTGAEVPGWMQKTGGGAEYVATVLDASHGPGTVGNGYVWHCFMELQD